MQKKLKKCRTSVMIGNPVNMAEDKMLADGAQMWIPLNHHVAVLDVLKGIETNFPITLTIEDETKKIPCGQPPKIVKTNM